MIAFQGKWCVWGHSKSFNNMWAILHGDSCLGRTGIANIEKFATQWKDAILITANDTEATDG
jgi:hypothetical protein